MDRNNFDENMNERRESEQNGSGGDRFVPWNMQQGQGNRRQTTYGYANDGFREYVQSDLGDRGSSRKKGLIICLIVVLVVVAAGVGCNSAFSRITSIKGNSSSKYEFRDEYVGVLGLKGTITDGESGDGYNQKWIIERINQMKNDDKNKGILLNVNTPGGNAYATAELYKTLMEYKKASGNPIFVYFGSQATSGGYYAAMAGDQIYANPECWTGSIGVIVGTLYDLSGLYDKFGVKAFSIKSGENKDIGASYKEMSEEQRQIFQGLVDDSYSRFVKVVMEGRKMDEATVRKLGDGRIYTAGQALENGLIDKIGSLDDAAFAMREKYNLKSVNFETISYEPEVKLFRQLLGLDSKGKEDGVQRFFDMLQESSKITVQYIAPVQK